MCENKFAMFALFVPVYIRVVSKNLRSVEVLVEGSGAGAQRKCPVVVSCDEKRQFSCSACKLAWRITDTQPRYIAQVSHRGSRSRRKIPSKL